MRNRLAGLILALGLVMFLLPTVAFATDGDFIIEDGILTEYAGSGGNVVLPTGVTAIGEKAFAGCGSVVSVVIQDGVKIIGDQAFADCLALESVVLPQGLTEIGAHAFLHCYGLKRINIPASVSKIGSYAFEGTGWMAEQGEFPVYNGILLEYRGGKPDVVIPDTVTVIGCAAFRKCNMTRVTIPNSVKRIEEYAFEQCVNLEEVDVPDGVLSIGYAAFRGCEGLTAIEMPDSVEKLGEGALEGCESLRHVILPSRISKLDHQMLRGCFSLETVTLPDSVEEIGREAFKDCGKLAEIKMGDRVRKIGQDAFDGTPWLETQGDFAVANGILLQYQGRSGEVVIPESVTKIGALAFYGRRLRSLILPQALTLIGESAFRRCSGLTSFTIPASVDRIEKGAFEEFADLTQVRIEEGVTEIGERAFYLCKDLKSVYIPKSVTEIGEKAFYNIDYSQKPYEQPIAGLCIHGEPGSYAEAYAKENGIPFVVEDEMGVPVAYASLQPILVDSEAVDFQAYALKDENGNDTNYVKLRDVAQVLNGTSVQFQVGWDGAVNIETGKPYTSNGSEMKTPFSGNRAYEAATAPTNVNGQTAALEAIVLKDDNGGAYTYYKLRDLGNALNFKVDWSAEKGIFIETE